MGQGLLWKKMCRFMELDKNKACYSDYMTYQAIVQPVVTITLFGFESVF